MPPAAKIAIPSSLLPQDGRFGCGPSKIRPEQMSALQRQSLSVLGTSHRQSPVRNLVGSIREQMHELFSLPSDWQVVLGNGGATLFWDAATFGLIERRSEHLTFGEFSAKFAQAAQRAPHIGEPIVIEAQAGQVPSVSIADVDTYCLTHNETSTGAAMKLVRPSGPANALVIVDATSAAGGIAFSTDEVDVYYFSPQKCFASEGGIWFALCSPRAIERISQIAASGRWCPASLDISVALENSVANQTLNTPAIGTLILLREQLQWMIENGGMRWCTARTLESSQHIYDWAESRDFATPFVADPSNRSPVVATIDIAGVEASAINRVLRDNNIVDTDSYRKLGRNQLRIATFPAIEPSDVRHLTDCIDYVIEALS